MLGPCGLDPRGASPDDGGPLRERLGEGVRGDYLGAEPRSSRKEANGPIACWSEAYSRDFAALASGRIGGKSSLRCEKFGALLEVVSWISSIAPVSRAAICAVAMEACERVQCCCSR